MVRDLQAQTKGFSRREHKYATLYSDSQALAGDALNKMIDQFSDVNAQNPFLLEKAFTGRPHMWKRYLSHILPSFRVFGKRKEALRSVAVCNKPSSAHCVRSRMPMSICSRRCSLRCIACTQSLRFLRLCSQMPDQPHCLHLFLSRFWSQILAPPHALHVLLARLCSQMLDPPHCVQTLLWRLCSQIQGLCTA